MVGRTFSSSKQKMDSPEFFKLSNHLCRVSPDGTKFANAILDKVIVYDMKKVESERAFQFIDNVQHLHWSPDSTMILVANSKSSRAQVWHLEATQWKCEIDEGSSGLLEVRWGPDSRHILVTAEFHLRITIWSLTTKAISYIQRPKNCPHYMDFTHDGKYLAVSERKDCKDYINIFDCSTWSTTSHFHPATENLNGISWSPVENILCAWESCFQYKMLMYSLNGQCLSSITRSDATVGIKSVTWSPAGQILAIGSFGGDLRLHNHLTWGLMEEFRHEEVSDDDVPVYKETAGDSSHLSVASFQNFSLPITKHESEPGISRMIFSSDSWYVASLDGSIPSCVWIWSLKSMRCCALMVLGHPVMDFSWDPRRPRLAVCSGSSNVFIWTPEGALSMPVPCKDGKGFEVIRIKWCQMDGSRLALIGHEQMCWCSMIPEQCQILFSTSS